MFQRWAAEYKSKLKIINNNLELGLAYYGENFGKDQNVEYSKETQSTIRKIEKLIREFLGIIMQYLLKEEELEI